MRTLLLFSFAVLVITACTKQQNSPIHRECVYDCDDLPMYINFSGTDYLPEEVDTIIIKQYIGDGTFSTLLSENLKTFDNNGQYDQYGAIIQKDVYGDGNDYEIIIPGAGQTYRIWNIAAVNKTVTITGESCDSGHFTCTGSVKDFELSGGAYELMPGDVNTIMLKH